MEVWLKFLGWRMHTSKGENSKIFSHFIPWTQRLMKILSTLLSWTFLKHLALLIEVQNGDDQIFKLFLRPCFWNTMETLSFFLCYTRLDKGIWLNTHIIVRNLGVSQLRLEIWFVYSSRSSNSSWIRCYHSWWSKKRFHWVGERGSTSYQRSALHQSLCPKTVIYYKSYIIVPVKTRIGIRLKDCLE